ncbi:MAG: ribokinase [Pontimonas sp.]|nr:ribokinase [Pontimonas sp.]
MKIAFVGGFGVAETMRVDVAPGPGETVTGGVLAVGPGGKASNQAVQALRLGEEALLISAVGRDSAAQIGRDLWVAEGVDDRGVISLDESTMVGFIIVDSQGENRISLAPGALDSATPYSCASALDLIGECDVVVVSFELNPAVGFEALRRSRDAGKLTVCNTAPAIEIPEDVLSCIDYLVPNESEARAIAEIMGWGVDSIESIAETFRAHGVRNVIITLGGEGVFFCSEKEASRLGSLTPSQVVDTTGAGDSFIGALAVSIGSGREIHDAIRFAMAAASLAVEQQEVIPSLPRLSRVEARLAEVMV